MSDKAFIPPTMVVPSLPTSPEKSLLIEVLKSAIRDILNANQGKRCSEAHHRRSAVAWIESEDIKGEYHFTFVEVCDALNLEPLDLRRKISQMLQEGESSAIFERRIPPPYKNRLDRRKVMPR